jgi:hypothetical protein
VKRIRVKKINCYQEERKMLEVTETATRQLSDFFKDKEIPGIRIFMNEGG